MIRPIDIKLNAAHPELPLVEATTFTGAPSSVFIRGVPKSVGNWSITAVNVAVTYPDNSTTTRAAVESAEGVWVATIPGTATSGRTAAGFKIMADGIDENGAAVTGYVLGFADFSVLSFTPVPAPGGTFWLLRYFDTMPTTPKKGDVAVVGGILKYYNGTTWLPFADLTNYYTKAETDEAIDKLAAYYITADAQGNPFATHAALVNAQTYYSGGAVRTPTRNDYAVVSADETHGGAEWRYIYAVDAQGVGQWEPQYAVEGVIAYDNTVTRTSASGVKSSGIWSAIWGALSALPTGFASLYDWCVAQLAGKASEAEAEALRQGKQDALSAQQLANIAAVSDALSFDATHSYAAGDPVVYNGTLYTFTTTHTGAWTGNDVSAVDIIARLDGKLGNTGNQTLDGSLTLLGIALTNGTIIYNGSTFSLSPWMGGTLALMEHIAPDFSAQSSYEVGQLVVQNFILKRCTTAGTGSAAVFASATVEDVLAALRAAIAGKADVSAIRYAISESLLLTVTSGAASTTLDDRTHNVRTVAAPGSGNTTTITATLPPIVAGKSRDMFLNLTVGSAASDAGDISLSIVEPSGATVQIDIGSVEDIGIGKNEILFSENALPTTSGNVTTTHWLVTVRHEDFAS